MKKEYKKPFIGLLPTRCDISTLSPVEPEDIDKSRRSLLICTSFIATIGHVSLYAGNGGSGGCGPGGCGNP